MENKSHALVAGLFTLLLLATTIAVAMWLTRDRTGWVPYQIATRQSVTGLSPQAAVRYRGLDVGHVESIRFDPDTPGQILVHINVRPETPVTRSTFATLGYQGVTGVAYVHLDDDGSAPAPLQTSAAEPARIPMRPSLFDQLQERGLAIMEQTEKVVQRVGTLLEDKNQQAILSAFENVSRAAAEFEALPRRLEPALARLPALAAQAQRTFGTLEAAAADARRLTGNLDGMVSELRAPDGTLDTITRTADQFGSLATRLENETLPLANDVRTSVRALNRTLNNLSERPQSVLFGSPDVAPGPGEPGFVAPAR